MVKPLIYTIPYFSRVSFIYVEIMHMYMCDEILEFFERILLTFYDNKTKIYYYILVLKLTCFEKFEQQIILLCAVSL